MIVEYMDQLFDIPTENFTTRANYTQHYKKIFACVKKSGHCPWFPDWSQEYGMVLYALNNFEFAISPIECFIFNILAIMNNPRKILAQHHKESSEMIQFALSLDGLLLKDLWMHRFNIIMVHTAIKQNGSALEFADERLRDDFRTVKKAIKQKLFSVDDFSADTLPNIEDDLKFYLMHDDSDDEDFVAQKLATTNNAKKYGPVLQHASERLRANTIIVSHAMERNGKSYKYITDKKLLYIVHYIEKYLTCEGYGADSMPKLVCGSYYTSNDVLEQCRIKTHFIIGF